MDALNKLQVGGISFVICDWNMPNMGELELLKSMRANHSLSTIPVVIVTAEAK